MLLGSFPRERTWYKGSVKSIRTDLAIRITIGNRKAKIKILLTIEDVTPSLRALVTNGGVPIPMVEQIKIQRLGGNRNKKIVDTVDVAKDLPLQNVGLCTSFSYHREYGTVENPIQLLPGSYEVTVTAMINGKRKSKTVGFDTSTCTFNPSIIVDF